MRKGGEMRTGEKKGEIIKKRGIKMKENKWKKRGQESKS